MRTVYGCLYSGEIGKDPARMGYGTRILIDEVSPGIDPLSPENKSIFNVGPFTGTNAPMAPQTCVVTKSPLTGTILNCYAGGFLGAEIKFSGIDGIILEGRSADWTIILIEDGRVSFHSAEKVTGKGTRVTENYMKELFGEDVRTLSIGQAGEKSVAMASIFSETRTFGRGGAGAVLGSKKVKGIAVRGTRGVEVAHPGDFQKLSDRGYEGTKSCLRGGVQSCGHVFQGRYRCRHGPCQREGIGDLLARGPGRAAEEKGSKALAKAMQIKNSGFAAWMPRRMKGTGLAFATSNRGA